MISLKCPTFQGLAETIPTPLQASTTLFKANQRRATQNQPQSPITREQILNGDLKNLLEDSNYNLTTMVIQYSTPITFSILSSNLTNLTIPRKWELARKTLHNLLW